MKKVSRMAERMLLFFEKLVDEKPKGAEFKEKYCKTELLDEADHRKQKVAINLETAFEVTGSFKDRKNKEKSFRCFSCGETGYISESSIVKRAGLVMRDHLDLRLSRNEEITGRCINSGATCHVSNDKEAFTYLNFDVQEVLRTANGESLRALGKGIKDLIVEAEDGVKIKVTIIDVLYVPEARGKLLSVRKLNQRGFKIIFDTDLVMLVNRNRLYKIGYLRNGLYMLDAIEQRLESTWRVSGADSTYENRVIIDLESDETRVDSENQLLEIDLNSCERDNNRMSDVDDNESSYYASEVSVQETDNGHMFYEEELMAVPEIDERKPEKRGKDD